ncbi:MAG: ATP-dependent DNA helicase [Halieaceae bacterium]
MPEYTLAVRHLAEFCHRSGDIDYRFTPSPTGEQGVAGHQQVYQRRGAGYQAEFALETLFSAEDWQLRIRGRADGYDADAGLIEEIKTCRVERASIPPAIEQLHWAQAKIYAALLCRQQDELAQVQVQLTYFNIDSAEEWPQRETLGREQLLAFLEDSVRHYMDWMQLQHAWRLQRDASITALSFPHEEYRPGQRQMAETVYKCIAQSGQLLLQAPTGIGKTAAVLFPALKALAADKHQRIAFVTARTVGRRAAEESLAEMAGQGLLLRRLTVTARERICFSPGKACHGDDCPYASGYYDRLPQALAAAMQETRLDREQIEALAQRFTVCPYQLGIDLLPWVDLCIADIHYLYSFNAMISSLFAERQLRWTTLLDEAHNLPQRARDMFSATLAKRELMAAKKQAGGKVKSALERLNRELLQLDKETWQDSDFDSRATPPESLLVSLQRLVAAVVAQQAENPLLLQQQPALLDFYFELLQFQRVLEVYDEDYRFEMTRSRKQQSLVIRLRCLDASRLLSERQLRPVAVVAFSATVSPPQWVLQELGFAGPAVFQELPSPFSPGQYKIQRNTRLDTRFRARAATLPALAASISEWLRQTPGNCIVYFSAYQYMSDALELLRDAVTERHLCVQQRNWDESSRDDLLETLRSRQDVAAFCILGGVFGEGIDLPGEALRSVVVVGVGLPQFNRERESLRDYYQQKSGLGYEYAYVYPGMQRVSQALGRVIRRESDQGSALLIDPRYADAEYSRLLPPWWEYSEAPWPSSL